MDQEGFLAQTWIIIMIRAKSAAKLCDKNIGE